MSDRPTPGHGQKALGYERATARRGPVVRPRTWLIQRFGDGSLQAFGPDTTSEGVTVIEAALVADARALVDDAMEAWSAKYSTGEEPDEGSPDAAIGNAIMLLAEALEASAAGPEAVRPISKDVPASVRDVSGEGER